MKSKERRFINIKLNNNKIKIAGHSYLNKIINSGLINISFAITHTSDYYPINLSINISQNYVFLIVEISKMRIILFRITCKK